MLAAAKGICGFVCPRKHLRPVGFAIIRLPGNLSHCRLNKLVKLVRLRSSVNIEDASSKADLKIYEFVVTEIMKERALPYSFWENVVAVARQIEENSDPIATSVAGL
ncbi:unnamed protein product [Xylocopa violacea]|uniref:Uncharacterized protein n=1 Tax=Xylocopa violacea TaxID=135666 RepID=A0ABP1NML3_XYLVO